MKPAKNDDEGGGAVAAVGDTVEKVSLVLEAAVVEGEPPADEDDVVALRFPLTLLSRLFWRPLSQSRR